MIAGGGGGGGSSRAQVGNYGGAGGGVVGQDGQSIYDSKIFIEVEVEVNQQHQIKQHQILITLMFLVKLY